MQIAPPAVNHHSVAASLSILFLFCFFYCTQRHKYIHNTHKLYLLHANCMLVLERAGPDRNFQGYSLAKNSYGLVEPAGKVSLSENSGARIWGDETRPRNLPGT